MTEAPLFFSFNSVIKLSLMMLTNKNTAFKIEVQTYEG